MQDFIENVVSQFGITEEQAKGATGGLFSLIQDNIDGSTFSELKTAIPAVSGLITSFQNQNVSSSSALGSLASFAGSMMGGKAKVATQAFQILQNFQLNADQSKSFATQLGAYIKGNVGDTLFSKLTDGFPEVKDVL